MVSLSGQDQTSGAKGFKGPKKGEMRGTIRHPIEDDEGDDEDN